MRTALKRWVAVCGLIAVLVPLAGAVPATGGPPPILARSVYVVRPDPRLCPSPLCGGYWVSLANHARTRCHDGLLRPRCYVAIAIGASTREPLTTGLPTDALARAVVGSWTFEGFGELGAIFVADVWKPVGRAPPAGDFFRLRDTGVRCIRAPCFSFRVGRLNTSSRTALVSGIDLGPARDNPEISRRAETALGTPEGLLSSGRITATADGGRLFGATQVYLKTATPRA